MRLRIARARFLFIIYSTLEQIIDEIYEIFDARANNYTRHADYMSNFGYDPRFRLVPLHVPAYDFPLYTHIQKA